MKCSHPIAPVSSLQPVGQSVQDNSPQIRALVVLPCPFQPGWHARMPTHPESCVNAGPYEMVWYHLAKPRCTPFQASQTLLLQNDPQAVLPALTKSADCQGIREAEPRVDHYQPERPVAFDLMRAS